MKQLHLLLIFALVFVAGCTANVRAKHFGGDMTINVPPGNKIISATWKQDQLWYHYRPMHPGEVPEVTIFKERSSFGMLEGSVTFIESK